MAKTATSLTRRDVRQMLVTTLTQTLDTLDASLATAPLVAEAETVLDDFYALVDLLLAELETTLA